MASPRSGAMSLGAAGIVSRLRAMPSVVVSVMTTVLVASFVLGAAPRLLDYVSEQDLRATVTNPAPAQRNLRSERATPLPAGPSDDAFLPLQRAGDAFARTEFPPSVQTVISDQHFLVDSPQFALAPLPGDEAPHPFDMFLRFRYQDGIEENARVVSGSLPSPREPVPMLVGDGCPTDPSERADLMRRLADADAAAEDDLDCMLADVPVFEIAVTAETLDTLGIGLDQMMLLTPDPGDPLFFNAPGQTLNAPTVVSVSGVIELTDPDLEYWYGDPSLHRPSIEETADFRIIFATGLLSPDALGDLTDTTGDGSWAQTWRYFVDPDLIVDEDLELLEDDLRRLQIEFSPISTIPAEMRVITQLPELLAGHREQRDQTVAMLSLAISGLFGVAVAVLALLSVLMTVRQRRSIVLTRSRGASPGQLTMTRFLETTILVAPAAAVGYLLAWLALPGREDLFSYRLVVALAAVTIVISVWSAIPMFTRRLGSLQSESSVSAGSGSRRLVFEALVLVVVIGAVLVLRRRGEIEDGPAAGSFDALLAVTPLLIAITAGLVALRVFPLLAGISARVAALTRGAIAFIGFSRLVRRPLRESLPVAVVLVCVATAAISSIGRNSIETGQVISSWQVVGADFIAEGFRTGVNLPSRVDVAGLAPDRRTASGKLYTRARIETDAGFVNVDVLAIETDRYSELTAGTPGTIAFPPGVGEPAAGTADDPVPVIASQTWPSEVHPVVGDQVELDLGRLRPVGVVVQIRESFPGIAPGRSFLVADLPTLASISELSLPPTVAYLRGSRLDTETLRASLAEQSPTARLTSRYEILDEIVDDPFVSWSTVALDITFSFSLTLGVMAAISGLALGAATRRRDLGFLRTLGVVDHQATAVTAIEQLPTAVLATIMGLATGVLTASLLAPAIVLDGFTGQVVPTRLLIDWPSLVTLGLVVIGSLAAGIGIFVLVSRRDDLGRALRVGDIE
ncbi:MAG: FtsX-like permease family protein [Acidimicrobiia bacterium]